MTVPRNFEGVELFIRMVPYTKYDATVLVRWFNYTHYSQGAGRDTPLKTEYLRKHHKEQLGDCFCTPLK
jgi:hypothetical protein